MGFKCVHISDIHFRGLTRHDEYRESFTHFFKMAKDLNPDVIFVGGDIVHSKTQGISPELIDILNWWFTGLAEICPTHIILGNHDGLMLNKDRQDAISPIITALNNPNLFLYKKSGTYPTGIPGYNWGVFSCFDMDGWKDVKPVPGDINIATFHGGVEGSTTDINWNIEGEVDVGFFKDWDFTFLGDIHKLQYLNNEKTIAYPGSTIQQNYGEDPGKGFLFWDIESPSEYSSTFYEIPHTMPFVTIDWAGDISTTLDIAESAPDGSRFRIRTNKIIPQAEIKQLHTALKEFKDASEIVYKNDYDTDLSVISTNGTSLFKDDLRDTKTHCKLMKDYYSDLELTDEEWASLDSLTTKFVNQIAHGDSVRNTKWSVRKLEFDNLFCYGKGNVVNFSELNGITGLFGPNRTGKSSIPGAIMYGLYNTTDRGPIKNLHIINARKGFCRVNLEVSVNGRLYRVERQSTKHETRKGVQHAVTHLNLFLIDEEGNKIQDLSGEQRRETEKVVRRLIGSSDDFLMTSLASQGEMNNFIKHRATKRKEILTNFLDLNIFEEMLIAAKEESAGMAATLKKAPDREWDTVILEKTVEKDRKTKDREAVDEDLTSLRRKHEDLKIILATHKNQDLVTSADIEKQEQTIDNDELQLVKLMKSIEGVDNDITVMQEKLDKIKSVKEMFPIDDLRERFDAQQNLERNLVDLEHTHSSEKTLLKSQKKSIAKLDEVPCGDAFPMCKYIKESHKNKKLAIEQAETVAGLLERIRAAKKSLKVLQKEDLQTKLEKYEGLISQESQLKVKISKSKVDLHEKQTSCSSLKTIIEDAKRDLASMRLRVSDGDEAQEISSLKSRINELVQKINSLDIKRMSLSESVGLLTSEIEQLKAQRDEYKELMSQWRVYDLFMSAVSKKGIPLQIITSQLPAINSEISKILQDVVGFTVELEADSNSNTMDIYINYGDSRRIIECASGMEKMMASLAIRVALINVSSLPKTDLLIIDEGFGALDDMNVESCNRLLKSLKRWFKNIIVISHVDGVKDVVDNVIDISKRGKDSKVVCNGVEGILSE